MEKREEFNKLVVITLGGTAMKASTLHAVLMQNHPNALRKERIDGAKSLSKVINTFPDIDNTGTPRQYFVKRQQ